MKSRNSFTLIEILIVIAIIGILLGIILVGLSGGRVVARDAVRMTDLRTLEKMLEIYKEDHGRYPTSTIDFRIEGYAWDGNWEEYGVVPEDPLSPNQDYAYVSDYGRDYQIYAKFEREPVNPTFACTEPCGPNAEYNGGISNTNTSTLVAFVPPPPPPKEEEPVICPRVLASGEQTYNGSTPNNPQIFRIIVDPLDVNKFGTQTVIAGNPIFEVAGEARTNTMSFPFSLELISGSEINGTWQGFWENEDEYCRNYGLAITATSLSGTSMVELTFN
jgi:prepilin-type N-terminal cleavage/methylation domain-containing protein